MKRLVVLTLLAAAGVIASSAPGLAATPTALGRTGWEVARPYNPVATAAFPTFGHAGFYGYIPGPIPGASDPAWSECGPSNSLCPNADTVGMNQPNGSRLGGFTCLASADFTFFQSFVSVPAGATINEFKVVMSGADDGARVSIYNSVHANGLVIPGSYIVLTSGAGSTSDLSAYLVKGEVNRVLVTQVDNCATGNNLHSAQIVLNGAALPQKPADDVAPNAAPIVTPAANPAGWRNSPGSVAWNWTDDDSGVDAANCLQSSTFSAQGTTTLTSTCKDLAGNSASSSVTVKLDTIAPTAAPVVTPAPNTAGWHNAPVSVTWNWSDGNSGIDADNCLQSNTSSGEGTSVTVTSTCKDVAGNSASSTVTVKVDTTVPIVTYTGSSTYAVDQLVSLSCSATDTLSGIATHTCVNVAGAAWTYGAGAHTVSASATDRAGNTGSTSATFTVTVDARGLCELVRSFTRNHGIANSLCVKLRAAAAAAKRGQTKTQQNNLAAYASEVEAQSGKAFTAAEAAALLSLARAL